MVLELRKCVEGQGVGEGLIGADAEGASAAVLSVGCVCGDVGAFAARSV